MSERIAGIHHTTAISADAQANLEFYIGVLGLRLVKRTVNFDDPGTFHFYFSDYAGTPGAVLTFFPWRRVAPGRRGTGEVRVTSFAVGPDSLGWWVDRLASQGVDFEMPRERFDESYISFSDSDGMLLEIVASPGNGDVPADAKSELPQEHAIRGFHAATIAVAAMEPTVALLRDVMGFAEIGRMTSGEESRLRFRSVGDGQESLAAWPGRIIDVVHTPEAQRARLGAGSVHHIAFRTPDDEAQKRWRGRLASNGQHTTEILDRQYFHSIYFREPGGTIFEFATDPPGFTTDESIEELGSGIRLPPWLEPRREEIEQQLPRVRIPEVRI